MSLSDDDNDNSNDSNVSNEDNNNGNLVVIKQEATEESAVPVGYTVQFLIGLPKDKQREENEDSNTPYYRSMEMYSLIPVRHDSIYWYLRENVPIIGKFKLFYYYGMTLSRNDDNYENMGLMEKKIKMERNENSNNSNMNNNSNQMSFELSQNKNVNNNNNNNNSNSNDNSNNNANNQLIDYGNNDNNNNSNNNENYDENDNENIFEGYWMRFDQYYDNGFYEKYPLANQPRKIIIYVDIEIIFASRDEMMKQLIKEQKEWISVLKGCMPYTVSPWFTDNIDTTINRMLADHGLTGMFHQILITIITKRYFDMNDVCSIIAPTYVMLVDHHRRGPVIELHNIEGVDLTDRNVIDKTTYDSVTHWLKKPGLHNCKTVMTANCRYKVTSRMDDQLRHEAKENNENLDGPSARIKNENNQLINNGNSNNNNNENNNENVNRRGFYESDSDESDNNENSNNYPCRTQGHLSFINQTLGKGDKWPANEDNGKATLRYWIIVRHDFQQHRGIFHENLYVNNFISLCFDVFACELCQ